MRISREYRREHANNISCRYHFTLSRQCYRREKTKNNMRGIIKSVIIKCDIIFIWQNSEFDSDVYCIRNVEEWCI
jgi:hypothetical protein